MSKKYICTYCRTTFVCFLLFLLSVVCWFISTERTLSIFLTAIYLAPSTLNDWMNVFEWCLISKFPSQFITRKKFIYTHSHSSSSSLSFIPNYGHLRLYPADCLLNWCQTNKSNPTCLKSDSFSSILIPLVYTESMMCSCYHQHSEPKPWFWPCPKTFLPHTQTIAKFFCFFLLFISQICFLFILIPMA